MENSSNDDLLESSSTGVFEIPGEPAIVINGLPSPPSSDAKLFRCIVTDAQPQRPAGFGEWLEGRNVKKLFGEQFFYGKVIRYDVDTGWYRVEYEDGDFEDLEWHELEQVLVPLDVNIPLRTLAMKMIKRKHKSVQKSEKSKFRRRSNVDYDGKGKEEESSGFLRKQHKYQNIYH